MLEARTPLQDYIEISKYEEPNKTTIKIVIHKPDFAINSKDIDIIINGLLQLKNKTN